jgi:hypothetical protein
MRNSTLLVAGVISAIFFADAAQAQQVTVVNYICNIEGAPAQLTAQVQTVNGAAVFQNGSGGFGGSFGTGDVNYYYQGTLVSATSRYSFTGTNQYADFTDLLHNERFRVQMIAQGQQLQMIINPQGPGPVQNISVSARDSELCCVSPHEAKRQALRTSVQVDGDGVFAWVQDN